MPMEVGGNFFSLQASSSSLNICAHWPKSHLNCPYSQSLFFSSTLPHSLKRGCSLNLLPDSLPGWISEWDMERVLSIGLDSSQNYVTQAWWVSSLRPLWVLFYTVLVTILSPWSPRYSPWCIFVHIKFSCDCHSSHRIRLLCAEVRYLAKWSC